MKRLPKSKKGIGYPIPFKIDLKMRLAILCFLLPFLGMQAKTSFAQKTITLNVKEASVFSLLENIEGHTDYKFVYRIGDVDLTRSVDLKVKKERIPKVLDRIFKDAKVDYKIIDNYVFLKEQEDLSYMVPPVLTKKTIQQMEITGTVTDEDGVPIPGVNIFIEGTTRGTSTDFDGGYTIDVKKGQTLIFSYVGFEEHREVVGQSSTINIQMSESSSALDEVVVTAFGRKINRNESTSNIVTVSSDEIAKTPFATAQEALQGKVAGLKINNVSGIPGTVPQVLIRGVSSINAGSTPLYVIDGSPVNSGNASSNSSMTSLDVLSTINPSDISSISVLKDASSTAPYGADGANGVILIETKSGNAGREDFEVHYRYGISNPATHRQQSLGAEDLYDAFHMAQWNGHNDFVNNPMPNDDEFLDDFILNELGIDDLQHWKDIGRPSTNWYKSVRNKDAPLHSLNFSFSHSSPDGATFYGSAEYTTQEGVVKGTNFIRKGASLNYKTKLKDSLIDFSVRGRVSDAKQQGIYEVNTNFTNPIYTSFVLPSRINKYNEDGSINIEDFLPWSGGYYNPLWILSNDDLNNEILRGLGNVEATLHILDNLSITSRLSLDFNLRKNNFYRNPIHGNHSQDNGTKSETESRMLLYTTFNSIDYNFKLWEKHKFNFSAVQEYTRFKNNTQTGSGQNFPNDRLKYLNSAGEGYAAGSYFRDRSSMRAVALINYSYDKRYLVDASYSYQGDTRFSEKWDSFYSLGLGWNIHEENFLKPSGVIDELRLKFGYGITGNASIGINRYQALYGFGHYSTNPDMVVDEYGTDATWEKNRKLDVALDYSLFDSRLSGTFGFFNNETYDMLLDVIVPLSALVPGNSVLENTGKLRNQGFEFELYADLIRTGDLKWNVGFNIGTLSDKITELPETSVSKTSKHVIEQGHSLNEWYMREWAGVDPANGDALWYVDRTKDPDETTTNVSDAKQQYTGKKVLPTYTGGFSTNLSFKNFFVNADLYFSGGNYVYEPSTSLISSTSNGMVQRNTTDYVYKNAWRKPGDQTRFPRFDAISTNIANAYSSASTFQLHDGTYVRLRNVSIGYNLRKEVLKNLPLDNVILSISGTNLWTWVKDSTLRRDPEVSNSGDVGIQAASNKTLTFDVNIKF